MTSWPDVKLTPQTNKQTVRSLRMWDVTRVSVVVDRMGLCRETCCEKADNDKLNNIHFIKMDKEWNI